MKPPEAVAAVKVAQVPPMYQVPPLMIQPAVLPAWVTGRVPRPVKGVPGGGVGVEPGGEVVGVGEVDLGRYFMPVAGQEEVAPAVRAGGGGLVEGEEGRGDRGV